MFASEEMLPVSIYLLLNKLNLRIKCLKAFSGVYLRYGITKTRTDLY